MDNGTSAKSPMKDKKRQLARKMKEISIFINLFFTGSSLKFISRRPNGLSTTTAAAATTTRVQLM